MQLCGTFFSYQKTHRGNGNIIRRVLGRMDLGQGKSFSGDYPWLKKPASCLPLGKGHPAPEASHVGLAEAYGPSVAQANLSQPCCLPPSAGGSCEDIFNGLLYANLPLSLLPKHPSCDSCLVWLLSGPLSDSLMCLSPQRACTLLVPLIGHRVLQTW